MAELQTQPHIISIPFPLYGHITPMLQICRTLAALGFSITLITTQPYHSTVAHHLRHHPCPRIHHLSVSHPLPPHCRPGSSPISDFFHSCDDLKSVVEPLVQRIVGDPQVSSSPAFYILSDVHLLAWTLDIVGGLRIPRIALWTSNAAECQAYFHAAKHLSQGYLPFRDIVTDAVASIPGLPPLHPAEIQSLRQQQGASHISFSYFVRHSGRMHEADMVLINSFLELESCSFNALREAGVKANPVGPLFLLEEAEGGGSIASKDEQEGEEDMMEWLDARLPNSVLYIAFGSITPLSHARVVCIATSLERMGQPFLWALRGGSAEGASDPLPEGFRERMEGKGRVVEWVRQRDVLRHPSVGGFLTHCGWNSFMESIAMGVPMLCSPVAGDQILTAKMAVDLWKVGLRLSEENMDSQVREIMGGELGKQMRKTTSMLGDAARKAVEEGGASAHSLSLFKDFHC